MPEGAKNVGDSVGLPRLPKFSPKGFGVIEEEESEVAAPAGLLKVPKSSPKGLALSSAMKDSLVEYQDIGCRLMNLLAWQHEIGKEVTEEYLAVLCIEQLEEEIQTERELDDLQKLAQVVINRLEMKDGAIVEIRPSEDPERSVLRVLALRLDLCVA